MDKKRVVKTTLFYINFEFLYKLLKKEMFMKRCCSVLAFIICVIIAINLNVGSSVNAATSDISSGSAKSYIVMDQNGSILVEKNSDEKREVASICKLMTTLLTLENIDNGKISLEEEFVASARACAVEGSQAFLDAGSSYSVEDLLKSVIVASANDSAIVLAEGIGGNENNFVNMMNAKAKTLGMNNTKYFNSTGLHEGEQYSTAKDTAILLNEVSKYDIYQKDCSIWMDELIHPSGRKTELVNTNRLIKYYPHCITGKTGYTDEAGYCLSSTAMKNNLHLTCVVLGCDNSADRFTESVELYNYAYANFTSKKIVDKSELLEINVPVKRGKEENCQAKASEDFVLTEKIGEDKGYEIEYEIFKDISAPIKTGDCVGNLLIVSDGKIIKSIDIVSAEDIDKQTYFDVLRNVVDLFNII